MGTNCRSLLAGGMLLMYSIGISHLHCAQAGGVTYMPSANELHKSLVDQSRTAGQSPSPAPGGNNGGATGTVDDYIKVFGGTPPNNTTGNGSNGSSTDTASTGRRLLRNLLGEWPGYAAPAHCKAGNLKAGIVKAGNLKDDKDNSLQTSGALDSIRRVLIAVITPTTSRFCPPDHPLCYFDEPSSTTDAANNTASGNGTSADHHDASPGRRLLHNLLGV